MWQYHYWNSMNYYQQMMFPMYCMAGAYQQQMMNGSATTPAATQQNGAAFPVPPMGNMAGGYTNIQQPVNNAQNQNVVQGVEYRVPPIWKRVVAELIDFILLLLIKIGVACMLVDLTGGLSREFQPLDMEQLLVDGELDVDRLLNMTTELMLIEVVNRIFISLFEAMCLRHGIHMVGGSTPGKRVVGLCVVSCTEVTDLPDNRVLVVPAQNIGFWNALKRSVVKNFSMAFLFPICVTALFFNNGQAAYDILANCIVVEDRPRDAQR